MFRKILYPTDFSPGALRAMERFEKENTMEVEECILLHVIDEGMLEDMMMGYSYLFDSEEKEMEELISRAKDVAMKQLREREEKCGKMMKARKIRTMVRVGVPYEEIAKVAEEEDVSLIILPSHGKLGYSREILGSTTIRVIRMTKKPVLVIKTHKEG